MSYKFELGSELKSKVTGFQGINVANSTHLNGCNRCYVQPKVKKDGKIPDGNWLDEPELLLVKKPKAKAKPRKTGGFSSRIK